MCWMSERAFTTQVVSNNLIHNFYEKEIVNTYELGEISNIRVIPG